MLRIVSVVTFFLATSMPNAMAESGLSYIDAGCASAQAAVALKEAEGPGGCISTPGDPDGKSTIAGCAYSMHTSRLLSGVVRILSECVRTIAIPSKADHEEIARQTEARQDARWTKLLESLREIPLSTGNR